jgi:hypothetical protein
MYYPLDFVGTILGEEKGLYLKNTALYAPVSFAHPNRPGASQGIDHSGHRWTTTLSPKSFLSSPTVRP